MHDVARSYCITGVSGYLGSLLARQLAEEPQSRVLGIDVREPPVAGAFDFLRCDIRDPRIGEILRRHAVDTLIHLAFYTLPEGDARLARSINLLGTENVLRAAAEARIRRFVLASSAAAYGSHDDNPVPLDEHEALRPNSFFYYSWHKAVQERLARRFARRHPQITLVILRPCVLIGPSINNPTGESLRQKLLIYMRGRQAPIQLLHEEDAVQAFRAAARARTSGIFNVAGDGTLTYPDFARLMKKRIVLLPLWLLAPLATLAKCLGLSPVGAATLRFIRHPIVIDPARFNREFGFRPKFDAQAAFMKFVDAL